MIPGEGDLRPMHYIVVWRCYTSTKRMHHVSFYAAVQARNAYTWFGRGLALLYKHETHASCGVLRCYTSTKRMCVVWRRLRGTSAVACAAVAGALLAAAAVGWRRLFAFFIAGFLPPPPPPLAPALLRFGAMPAEDSRCGVLGMGCTRCMSVTARIVFFYLACGMCQNANEAGQLKSCGQPLKISSRMNFCMSTFLKATFRSEGPCTLCVHKTDRENGHIYIYMAKKSRGLRGPEPRREGLVAALLASRASRSASPSARKLALRARMLLQATIPISQFPFPKWEIPNLNVWLPNLNTS